jgi:putative nucleotidyltransferase with HDIG domain
MGAEPGSPPAAPFTLEEETEAVRWIHQELKEGRALGVAEAEMVTASLGMLMRSQGGTLVPQIRKDRSHRYCIPHALNVCALAMALGRAIGLDETMLRRLGVAALLHDVGKVKVPDEILFKSERLNEEERAVLNRHPEEGARIILSSGGDLELAAVVAYEHHVGKNGSGYPAFTHPRGCHPASDLVHVCNVFDALRSLRPYREAWSANKALSLIQYGAGEEFDAGMVRAFVQMVEDEDTRMVEVTDETRAFDTDAGTSQ